MAEKTIEFLENENKALRQELKRLHVANAETTRKMNYYADLYRGVISSGWWKITTPFRKLQDVLKRIPVIKYFGKALAVLIKYGPKALWQAVKNKRHVQKSGADFKISTKRREEESNTRFENEVKISVVVPLYNTPIKYLNEMIASVVGQTYSNWELCLADGSDAEHPEVGETVLALAAKDPRIVYRKLEKNLGISENTNAALDVATGDYISLFDHDDLLHPSALFMVVKTINEQKADFVYTDEVTFINDSVKNTINLHYKPDFSIDTLRSHNYICHLTTFKRSLLDVAGRFRKECDGSQDYDIILRLTEKAEKIVHIPEILYYWRGHKNSTAQDINSKPYIINAAHRALEDHLERVGLKGRVLDAQIPSTYRIEYEIEGEPLVSIVIANKDSYDILSTCLNSIFERSTYKNYEIIIVENNSVDKETFEYYDFLKNAYHNVKIVNWEGKFNYSAINNLGVEHSSGEYVVLLNNDVEVIDNDWIEQMLMHAQRKDVGAVGAMLYFPDNTIQHAGVILGVGGVAGHSHKYFPRGTCGYMSRGAIIQNYSAVTFACVMIPRAVFDEVGGIDESFEVAFNDVDMCMRIRATDRLIVFTPYCQLYHYESKSRGSEDTPEKVTRFNSEIDRFKARWGKELEAGDPYYNKHLTLHYEDFSFRNK